MSITDYFKQVTTWSAGMVRTFLAGHDPEEYNLVDVRQAGEYQEEHLPGAVLMPMSDLPRRLAELDSGRRTIVYCRSGIRSRAATALLSNAGFGSACSMEGGIRSWRGLLATELPEADLAPFLEARSTEEHIVLAWSLEEGTRLFYAEAASRLEDGEAKRLFLELSEAEEDHKATLVALFEGISKKPARADFPAGILEGRGLERRMEGGMDVDEALGWIEGKSVQDALEMAISLETNSYDHYLILRRELDNEDSRRVFEVLSDEENRHLQKLTRLLEDRLPVPGT